MEDSLIDARQLVAKGFKQLYNIDYCATWAPTGYMRMLRALIA
jgi:hypothetical protein